MADYDRNNNGLQELEPSPVEESPLGSKEDYFPSQNTPSNPTQPTTSTLGLSQHSPIWYLTRIQRYSSYVFTAYGVAHIINTSIIPLITRSVPESNRYLLLTRPYYQGIPAEPLLIIAPLWAHVISGVALRIVRRKLNAKRYGDSGEKEGTKRSFFSSDFWPRVSGVSKLGYPFLPLLAGHIFVNRAIPQQFPGGQSNVNLSYVAHAFAKHPVVSYVGFSALIGVTVQGGEREVWQKRRWYGINALAAVVAGLWMAGGFGVVGRGGLAPGYIGKMYDQMYQRIPVVGQWL
ncbi:hypothetical protein LTR12_000938 [Friedmanniomyces endolithicus]|nr:hypothetical protein LTR12_000938 [Friedmanniomyces endolithicus]